MRQICTSCGIYIAKSALTDPYLCRDCEKAFDSNEPKERYTYLDNLR